MLADGTARLAVLASGRGSNFDALARAAADGRLGGRIVALVTDRPECGAVERARRLGVAVVAPSIGRFRTRIEDERPWRDALLESGVDLVLLAGFMRRLHATVLEPFRGRILNLHPSLLPAFPGLDAIGQAWHAGVRIAGCTVHVVDDGLDSGAIVAQAAVPVRSDDTLDSLEARIHEAEHALYPDAVRRYLVEPWTLDGRRLRFGEGRGFESPARGARA